MYNEITLLGLGLVLGLGHAIDADHIVAVSALVSKHKSLKGGIMSGISWGLGHTSILFIVGLVLLLTKISIPEKIALSLEFIVGLMIVYLGIAVVYEVLVNKKHFHKHVHDGKIHIHTHTHKTKTTHNHYHKPFLVGLVHGMAGSAGLMLLILPTVENTMIGLAYILIFGIGSILGMGVASSLISLPFTFASKKYNKRIRYMTGIISITFGLFIMITTWMMI
jgi:sulfite exporter TauE/SafE